MGDYESDYDPLTAKIKALQSEAPASVYYSGTADVSGGSGVIRFDPDLSDGPFVTPSQADWDYDGSDSGPAFPVPKMTAGVYLAHVQYSSGFGDALLTEVTAYTFPYDPRSQVAHLTRLLSADVNTYLGMSATPMDGQLVVPYDGHLIVYYGTPEASPGRTLTLGLWLTKIA